MESLNMIQLVYKILENNNNSMTTDEIIQEYKRLTNSLVSPHVLRQPIVSCLEKLNKRGFVKRLGFSFWQARQGVDVREIQRIIQTETKHKKHTGNKFLNWRR